MKLLQFRKIGGDINFRTKKFDYDNYRGIRFHKNRIVIFPTLRGLNWWRWKIKFGIIKSFRGNEKSNPSGTFMTFGY